MIGLLKDVAALAASVPEIVPLLRNLITIIRSAGTKEEKLSKARRATVAAGMRTAFDKALPGSD
jgi:hypothetical protein